MPNEDAAYARWRAEKAEVTVQIIRYKSELEAIKAFRMHTRLNSNAGIPQDLKGVGDEAHFWPEDSTKPRPTSSVLLRKGKVLVYVNATPTSDITQRFARHALNQL